MPIGERAVVLGASMSGLSAARVLSDRFAEVTVIDRDRLPSTDEPRRGVPQGRHIHVLISGDSNSSRRCSPGCHRS
ncbi:NAD(P)-binding protein [Rhodococcus pyridinivorans]|uniref:NAD(P)-binding protein n=1 Tax=Rhodococcus pyridinivorans TaxID=103816 RepID=UPI000AB1039E|nr:NAD(P)-binding protein [Rhodococcus pyridinivorans]